MPVLNEKVAYVSAAGDTHSAFVRLLRGDDVCDIEIPVALGNSVSLRCIPRRRSPADRRVWHPVGEVAR